jgi:hypothetical protein
MSPESFSALGKDQYRPPYTGNNRDRSKIGKKAVKGNNQRRE